MHVAAQLGPLPWAIVSLTTARSLQMPRRRRSVKGLIRDIDPDAYTKPKLSASTTEAKEAKKARREETVRRKAVQEEMSLIAMRVFENLLARESAENTIDGSSQFERASCDVPVDSD